MIVLMTGLPGTGKSSLARAAAPLLDADVLDRDALRDAIFPARELDFSREQNELASQVLYRVAAYILAKRPERTLIFDGRPFSKREQVDEVLALAQRVGHPVRVILCTAPDAVVLARLQRDAATARGVDPRYDKYLRDKPGHEALVVPHLVIDTSQPLAQCVAALVAYVTQPLPPLAPAAPARL